MSTEPMSRTGRLRARSQWQMGIISLVILFLVALALVACDTAGTTSGPSAAVPCKNTFEATINQGPDAGKVLSGELSLLIGAAGDTTGMLSRPGKAAITATGQVNGRAINLAFDLGNNNYIFGVGTGSNDIRTCTGTMGGPFVGPNPGDTGDWFDPPYIRIISPNRGSLIVPHPDHPLVARLPETGEGPH